MTSILIVDDSKIIRSEIVEMLTQFGFTNLSEAINGLNALDIVERKMPDLITLDWNMPLMDGIGFIKALRKMPGGDKPKVILCTYERAEAKIKMAKRDGVDEYVPKPIDPAEMKEKIELLGFL